MVLQVLLVEDEYFVLKGLEIMLKEQNTVNLRLETAMDAVGAMHKLEQFHPDVVITDINMPEVDGLTMLRQIAGQYPSCRFIICSGYEDQKYLLQALQLHVADYLLKPVDKDYLIRRLKQIDDERQSQISHILLSVQLLLFKGCIHSQAAFSADELERVFPMDGFALCVTDTILPQDIAAVKERLTRYFEIVYVISLNRRSVFLINCLPSVKEEAIRSILSAADASAAWGVSVFAPEKEKAAAFQKIALNYQEALCDMILSILPVSALQKKTVLQKINDRTLFPVTRVIMFEASSDSYLNELYDPAKKELNYPIVFTEVLAAYIMISGISLPPDSIIQIYQDNIVSDIRHLSLFLKKLLNSWYDSFTPSEQAACSSKVSGACQYIDQHFMEDLSLDTVAEKLSINPSYLSYVFKKESGITFLQYLTNVRMQQACHLILTRPDLSLEAIAAQTGYHSSSYFHKIFRAKFGMSPRQWQSIHK